MKHRNRDEMRHQLLADLFELPIWYRGSERIVQPRWDFRGMTVEERDLIAEALGDWKPES